MATLTKIELPAADWDRVVRELTTHHEEDETSQAIVKRIEKKVYNVKGGEMVAIPFGTLQYVIVEASLKALADEDIRKQAETPDEDFLTDEEIEADGGKVIYVGGLRIETYPDMCSCGCGQEVKAGREFKPGHDQRHKGNLIRRAQVGDEKAEKELVRRRWRTVEEIALIKTRPVPRTGPRCIRCGQILSDPNSVNSGVGPICAHKLANGEDEGEN